MNILIMLQLYLCCPDKFAQFLATYLINNGISPYKPCICIVQINMDILNHIPTATIYVILSKLFMPLDSTVFKISTSYYN